MNQKNHVKALGSFNFEITMRLRVIYVVDNNDFKTICQQKFFVKTYDFSVCILGKNKFSVDIFFF